MSCSLYPQLDEINWKDVFELPYRVSRDTKYQTLQYKILNRVFPCNYMLAIWNVVDSELCTDCLLPDTLQHYFFECQQSHMFWINLSNWCNNTMYVYVPLNVFDILFGIITGNDDNIIFSLNYCILIGKWYIYRCHTAGKRLFFAEFLCDLKRNIDIEKYILSESQRDNAVLNDKWNLLFHAV
jgi:hypothetical protein